MTNEKARKIIYDQWQEFLEHNLDYAGISEAYKMAIHALEQTQPQQLQDGHWIEDAETYYKALNEYGCGVDEYTPYFTDDIACSECLAKYSTIDNETQFFKFCPNCGARMGGDIE